MDWERYDARLKALRPEVLREALRVYREHLLAELADEQGINGSAEMGYFGDRLAVVERWQQELTVEG